MTPTTPTTLTDAPTLARRLRDQAARIRDFLAAPPHDAPHDAPETEPDPEPDPVPDRTYSVRAGDALHLDLRDVLDDWEQVEQELPERTRWRWDFGETACYGRCEGFAAAHVYEQAGTYRLTLNDQPVATVRVRTDTRTSVRVGDQTAFEAMLGELEQAGDGKRYELAPRVFRLGTHKAAVWAAGATILGSAGTVIQHDGLTAMGGWFEVGATDVRFQGITFASLRTAPGARETLGSVFLPSPGDRRLVIRDCKLGEVGVGVLGNRRPDHIYLMDVRTTGPDVLRAYLAWMEGEDWVLHGCLGHNSEIEHIFRGPVSWCSVWRCDLANRDRGDLASEEGDVVRDYSKSCVWAMAGGFVTVARCTIDSDGAADGKGLCTGVSFTPYVSRDIGPEDWDLITEHVQAYSLDLLGPTIVSFGPGVMGFFAQDIRGGEGGHNVQVTAGDLHPTGINRAALGLIVSDRVEVYGEVEGLELVEPA